MGNAAAHGSHVFLVRSSLQYLLATALAADLRTRLRQDCRMFFLPGMLDPAPFLRAARDWAESPFDHVLFIEPQQGSGAIRRALRAALTGAQPLSLTVFNDREEASQTALITTARRFPHADRRCAEDGSLAYTDFVFRAHGASSRLRQTLRLGRHWHDVRVLGTHPLVQQFIALHPQLLRAELRGHRIVPFPAAALASPALCSLAAAMCAATGLAPDAVAPGAAVLTLSPSDYAARNPDYRARVAACAEVLARQPAGFFYKYHPREAEADPLGMGMHPNAREIARSLPVECLYLMLRDRPLTIVGGMSTSLLTAALLMPQVRCAALLHASAAGDAWNPQLYEALHIVPLGDDAAIAAFLGAAPHESEG
jgi:hypothetical protein